MSRIDRLMHEAKEAYDPKNTETATFGLGDYARAAQWYNKMRAKGYDVWLTNTNSDMVYGVAGKGLSTPNDLMAAAKGEDVGSNKPVKITSPAQIKNILDDDNDGDY